MWKSDERLIPAKKWSALPRLTWSLSSTPVAPMRLRFCSILLQHSDTASSLPSISEQAWRGGIRAHCFLFFCCGIAEIAVYNRMITEKCQKYCRKQWALFWDVVQSHIRFLSFLKQKLVHYNLNFFKSHDNDSKLVCKLFILIQRING